MASTTLTIQSSETWIYPPKTYTGVDWVYRPANTWTKNHSDPDRRARRYQAGNDTTDGDFNGNMMSHFHFSTGGKSMKSFISSIGGPSKITSIKLVVTCGHAYYSSMDLRVCLGPYWDTSSYHGKKSDTYDGLGIKHLTTVNIAKGATRTIDLTAYKNYFSSYETITMYVPGAYNKDYQAYGWIYGHSSATEYQKPKLIIDYVTNTAPRTPGITVNTASDGLGYIKPSLNVSMVNNGDPDNNIHSTPYYFQLYNQSGQYIREFGWQSSNNFTYDASAYRGQSLKIRAVIRDTEGLMAETSKTVYINSIPYWSNHGSEANAISYTNGVVNGVYRDNITISWPRATDAQNQTIKYNVYCQIGTSSGAGGDTSSTCIAEGLTGTSYSLDATSIKGKSIPKGERIYFSVWAHDGLESSSYRIVSSWIYREKPPTAPTNVAPRSGHYESSVNVSWSQSSGANGSYVQFYRVGLIDNSDSIIKSWNVAETSFTCNDIASLIGRGQPFKFKVVAVDNLGNDSEGAYSGTLKRNSAPSDPKNFKLNTTSIYVKNKVPLIWNASTDADGDAIKYNIAYNINNGSFQYLAKGLANTSYTHDISSLSAGSVINYYVEAYDTFNIYSNKVYIATKPQVNIPPSKPSFLLPYENRTLYTNVPRITFKVGESYNEQNMKIIINVNGKEYSSDKDISYFDKSTYSSGSQGMFIIPDSAPLSYSNNNSLIIKAFDGIDYSGESTRKLSCEALVVNKKSTGDLITANDINSLKAMINANRFAYGLSEISWTDGFLQSNKTSVQKKYFDQAINAIYDLNVFINDKTSSASLKRVYTKDVLQTNSIISKNVFNNMYDIIKKS